MTMMLRPRVSHKRRFLRTAALHNAHGKPLSCSMLILAREKVSVIDVSGREILVGKIHIRCDRVSGDHRHKSDFVMTTLAFGQDCSAEDDNQMWHPMSVVVDAIDATSRRNRTRHKMRR